MLSAIKTCHCQGIIHRDIKPSNFLVRASPQFPLVLIDFGLSRPYLNPDTGAILPARRNPGFVGTSKYASLNAHEGKELGRRDDLFSWFFIVVEMARGFLPWGKSELPDQIFTIKQSISFSNFLRGLPPGFKEIWRLVRKLGRAEPPNYDLIMTLLCTAMADAGVKWQDPYDWDGLDLAPVSSVPVGLAPGEVALAPPDLPEMPARPVRPPPVRTTRKVHK
jgi:serine/threonine protein kinase